MGKISQLHAELSEQASALGFQELGEAEQAGYGIDWENAKLIEPEKMAHEAWLKDKQELLNELYQLRDMLGLQLSEGGMPYLATINRAITFIGRVSHE